jgi:leucyl-tRNA synthetase
MLDPKSMNGTLHAGHSFSVSKVEFTAGVARMQGKKALFPMGFHCTGMPIRASADKLRDEIEMFGMEFERYQAEEAVVEEKSNGSEKPIAKEDITKFGAKKGKLQAKTVKMKYQFQIMQAIGIPVQEIHKFADTAYWLCVFLSKSFISQIADSGQRVLPPSGPTRPHKLWSENRLATKLRHDGRKPVL